MTNYCRWNVLKLVLVISINLPSLIYSSKVSSTLQVRLPVDLKKDSGNYDHREALFGVPPYGSKIEQQVYHANDPLCNGPLNVALAPPGQPFILMVDRGECTFVRKVRNAQHSGAMAVIIADNICQCKHKDICKVEEGTSCEPREPLMADDGSGTDITIPTMLMFKQDSDRIKAELTKKKPVRMTMAWSVPNPDGHVEYDLWSKVTDEKAREFQVMWLDALRRLGNKATFTPHYYIYDGLKAYCRDDVGNNYCPEICTNEGRYCASNDWENGVTGGDEVEESLRRLCIWQIYGNKGTGPELFQYVREFEQCLDKGIDKPCINAAAKRAGVDTNKMNKCMKQSGGVEDPGQNKVLQDQLDEVEENGIIVMPVAYVNGVPIRGTLDFDVVFKAVCAGYKKGTQPDICAKCSDCSDSGIDTEYICVLNDHCALKDKEGVSKITFGGGLTGVVLFFGILALIQHVRSKGAMRSQVKGILAEYMPVGKDGLGGVDTAITEDEGEEFEIS